MAWGKRQKLASRAITEGDLDLAAEYLKRDRSQQTFNGRRLTHRLTTALVQRAEQASSLGNFSFAWKDLATATELAGPIDEDFISRQKNQLVELTIESADSLLFNGKVNHAVQLVNQLGNRNIMDWRADRILSTSRCLQSADELAAIGKFQESIAQLEQAKNLQPDLPFLESRLAASRQRNVQLKELIAELQSSALKCHWSDVSKCCQKILTIAPKHQIALDAQEHCMTRMKRKTSAGLRTTHVPDKARISASNSFFHVGQQSSSQFRSHQANTDHHAEDTVHEIADVDSFLLWVDGVGGYLVCTDRVNTMGQAMPQANISIPIQGDLRRRHARLEAVGGHHLIQPLGPVTIDGQLVASPAEVKHNQTISLDGGVRLKYSQPHPLSKTARLDFVSRHRTCPWSDAILLASQSIILGPNRANHIFCPTWRFDLMLFERDHKWFCRTKGAFEIDDRHVDKEGEISFDSRIVGEDFSLTLEPIFVS
jgi:tetratricopeptide (TPR) repeat protein